MGVDVSVLDFLLKFRGKIKGRTLQLGRQNLYVGTDANHQQRPRAEAVFRRYDPVTPLEVLGKPLGYTEDLFRYLGADSLTAMDASPFEGAEIVHDLNYPVPPELVGQFDTLFDGGTIEHVFNAPMAFENAKRMLKVGGLLLSVNAANNQLGHGFYQFGPDLMWRIFSKECGFQVELMQLVVLSDTPQPTDALDPEQTGQRIEIGPTAGPTYILVAATKTAESKAGPIAYQSDYRLAWDEAEAKGAGAQD
jgi:hypothetical protein